MITAERKRHEQLLAEAKKTFSTHQISKRSDGRWLLQRRDSKDPTRWVWMMAAEIISLAGGALYVGGDIDYCIFAWYSDTSSHRDKLRWIGRCTDVDYYVRQKAIIGSEREITETWDQGIAHKVVKQWLRDEKRDDPGSHEQKRLKALLDDWHEDGFPESANELGSQLYDELGSDFICDRGVPGMVLAPRVYYAHAACSRLCDLLDDQERNIEPGTRVRHLGVPELGIGVVRASVPEDGDETMKLPLVMWPGGGSGHYEPRVLQEVNDEKENSDG